jgi:gluconate kinase
MHSSEITQAVKDSWKRQYGDIYEVTVDGLTGIFRDINKRDVISGSLKKAYSKDIFKNALNTLKLTWLGGDKDLLTDDLLVMAAFNNQTIITQFKILKAYEYS